MQPVAGWDENSDVVLVNLTTGKLAEASLNGRYQGKVSVDPRTGEVLAGCLTCTEKEHLVRRLERRIRGLELQLAELQTDRNRAAHNHVRWQEVEELFAYWKRHCRHPKSHLTPDRFYLALPYLERHGADLCRKAIDGAAFDAYETRRKNGTIKKHDDWSLIHRSADKWEEFVNRAPRQK